MGAAPCLDVLSFRGMAPLCSSVPGMNGLLRAARGQPARAPPERGPTTEQPDSGSHPRQYLSGVRQNMQAALFPVSSTCLFPISFHRRLSRRYGLGYAASRLFILSGPISGVESTRRLKSTKGIAKPSCKYCVNILAKPTRTRRG